MAVVVARTTSTTTTTAAEGSRSAGVSATSIRTAVNPTPPAADTRVDERRDERRPGPLRGAPRACAHAAAVDGRRHRGRDRGVRRPPLVHGGHRGADRLRAGP